MTVSEGKSLCSLHQLQDGLDTTTCKTLTSSLNSQRVKADQNTTNQWGKDVTTESQKHN